MPKYEQLSQALRLSIADGFWPPGARLPTETALTADTPYSLGTVQRALRDLVAEGLILRRRGAGTVVANRGRQVEQPWHMRFRENKTFTGPCLPVYVHVLAREPAREDQPWVNLLNQNQTDMIRIERCINIADRLEIFNRFYASAAQFPELADLPLPELDGTNIKRLIYMHHQLPVHRIDNWITTDTSTHWLTEKCAWPRNAPATVLNACAYSPTGDAMYFQEYFIPPHDLLLDLRQAEHNGTG